MSTRRVNLDERLAKARAEAGVDGEPPKIVVWRGTEWTLPEEFPLLFLELVPARQLTAALETLFGPGSVSSMRPYVSVEEAELMVEVIGDLYGATLGESGASQSS